LICEEQCPYGAIHLVRDEQPDVGVPVVDASKCNGCGWCEDRCPVLGDAAVVVVPHGELRLASGSYVEAARHEGLALEPRRRDEHEFRLDDRALPGQDLDRLPPQP
jgi:formate hydrogenlyase subunit 6/NADH:ubiquinone oxidoreductase subunit I